MLRSTCDSAAKLMTASTPLSEHRADDVRVADIPLDELMAGIIFEARKVFEIAGIGELIQIQYPAVRIFLEHVPNKIGSDKSGPACYQ